MKINLESRSKKIMAGTAAVFAFGAVLAAVSSPAEEVADLEAVAVSVDVDDGIGDGAEPLPVIDEPVIDEPVIEEPAIEEPVIEEPVIEEPAIEEPAIEEPVIDEPATEPVEPAATPEPEPVTLTPASMMRTFTPMLMADAGHPMSTVGEYAWSNVDDATFDGVGAPLCDSVSIIGLELTALALYDDVAAMLPAFGIDPTPAAVGGMVGAFAGAYCPDGI